MSWISGVFALPWWGYVVVTLTLTHCTIAAVTIYLHRHQAHRALALRPPISHFFRLWLWLTTGMVTKEWTAIHRKHHAKCETDEDPHSPQIALRHIASKWRRVKYVCQFAAWEGVWSYVRESHRIDVARYGAGTPDDWLERNVYAKRTKLGVALMFLADLILFGWVGAIMWVVQMIWIPVTAAGIINGVGHAWGYRNFPSFHRKSGKEDASRNIVPWGIAIGGEELHNNHHMYATSAKLSDKWYEFDIGWMYIRILQMVGLAYKVKRAHVRN